MTHSALTAVTARIIERSKASRAAYLERMDRASKVQKKRGNLGCANLAHGFAACGPDDKAVIRAGEAPNIGIVTAFNDMLSAHQPYERFPDLIKAAARASGGTAQVAGGVPAMCDGVTQGEAGMELSLFSRDVIAMATGIALSHQMFDAAMLLGVCDKIVPGLVIGSLAFGHLPAIFVPAGPMTSGMSNDEKTSIRQLHAEGKVGRAELLEAESQSYHGPGTCTFYGTANTNQMLMEIMGLHLPGSSFVNPNTPLRDALTRNATKRALEITAMGNEYTPLSQVLDERAFVNGIVGLNATGGSTNLTIHLIAMAAAAGIKLTWADFADIANIIPLITRVYPNGKADVNHFHAAGGMGFLINQLLGQGLLHNDVRTIAGEGLKLYTQEPRLDASGDVHWVDGPTTSGDSTVLRPVLEPFQTNGGLKVLAGDLGIGVAKISACPPDRLIIEAPARVFHDQESVQKAFRAGELDKDVIVVMRFQGPKANGMPELHKLMPPLTVLQNKGYRVALITDGRLSGASGKVPAALHVTPEAVDGGPIAKLQDGDIIRLDTINGKIEVLVEAAEWAVRPVVTADLTDSSFGVGRELFAAFRANAGRADQGAAIFN
eukprot:gene7678-7739_t